MSTPTTKCPIYQKIFLDAVRCGDALRLRRLLEADDGEPDALMSSFNVNVYAADGQTALHQCCRSGNLELVKLLVSYGADVRLATRDGWSALHIAVGAGHQDVARYLLHAHRR